MGQGTNLVIDGDDNEGAADGDSHSQSLRAARTHVGGLGQRRRSLPLFLGRLRLHHLQRDSLACSAKNASPAI